MCKSYIEELPIRDSMNCRVLRSFRMECTACGSSESREQKFREMMFGTREEFVYHECLECGCLQIAAVPENLGKYYPDNYYSFALRAAAWKTWLYRARFAAPRWTRWLGGSSASLAAVIAAKPKRGARILDVGSGGGRLVGILRSVGFDAHGIDPFLAADTEFVRRASLEDVEGGWDLIMFHHSLEHMADQAEVLRTARGKLGAGGRCIVRVPIANWAWREYGRDWAQLDAPRHLVIHTAKSFALTAEAAGLRIDETIYDSDKFQFYASEMYRRDIPLRAKLPGEVFSRAEMRRFKREAKRLNEQQLGDQAAFFLIAR
jgi:SAM-dependent methyltransferase